MATKRRGSGEGSIFRRADGRWVARIEAGYSDTGKRIRKTIYGATKKAVQDKLTKLQERKATGTLIDSGKMSVAEWLQHWLDRIAAGDVRPSTLASYRGIVAKHVTSTIGRLRLSKLSPVHLQALYGEMGDAGKSARTQQKTHAVLRRSLTVAVRQGLIASNPCSRIDPPKYQAPEMNVLTSEHAGKLISESEGDRFHALIVLALTCGLRQGELFGLQWDDIDLKTGRLSVRRTVVEINGKVTFGPPKSRSGSRSLRLPDVAVKALQDHRAIMLREGRAGASLVFSDGKGNPLRRQNFTRRYFKPLLKAAKVSDIRFHDLRHTSATMLLADGVHPKIVQERLGHSKVSVTLDLYSHVLPSMDEAAAGTFDRLTIPKKADRASGA